jgi:hypothetical protein
MISEMKKDNPNAEHDVREMIDKLFGDKSSNEFNEFMNSTVNSGEHQVH